ncbi:hypothetical protein EMCRGX_G000435 [Ephydatia muelleri]
MVHCVSCSRDVKADAYEAHKCTPSLTPNEEREAVVLLKKAISTSTEKGIIHLATGGTPMTFIQVTKARNPTTAVSSRTVKMRCSEMQTVRSIVSGGEPSALIQNEVLALNDEERRALLQKAGISSTIAIGAAEVLAIKAGLFIPWNKLRLLRRSERMATPLSVRGHAAQTLETMRADHQRYVSAGSIKRDAQKFYNCISPPIFDIPVSQLGAPLLQAELEEAQQAQENFQQMATYVVLVGGAERNPRAVNLLKQAADKKKHVKALETQVRKCRAAVKKGFNEKEGPFVKRLDSALQEIGVQCQQYFGGAFIGNHVHKALKV